MSDAALEKATKMGEWGRCAKIEHTIQQSNFYQFLKMLEMLEP